MGTSPAESGLRSDGPARAGGTRFEALGTNGVAKGSVLLAGLAAAALAGYLMPRSEGLLRLEASGSILEVAAVAAMIVAAAAVLRYPGVGLSALAVFVYLNLSQALVRYHQLPSLLQLLSFPLALAALSEAVGSSRRKSAATTLTLWLVLYHVVLLCSTVVATDRVLADERFIESSKGLVIYFLVVGLASSAERIYRAIAAMLAAGVLMGGLGVFQALTGSFGNEFGGLARIKDAQIYGDVFEPRIAGALGDPNFFAQVLVLLFPMALYAAWSESRWRGKVPAYAAAAMIAAACVLTYSRGAALALGVVIVLILVERKVRVQTVVASAVLLAAGLLVAPQDFTRRLATIEELVPGATDVVDPDSSFEERKLMTMAAWSMFVDHPIAGVGAGNYTVHFQKYADDVGSAARQYGDPSGKHYPHNLGLEIAAETGFLGLFAFFGVVVTCFLYLSRARRAFERARDPSTAAMAQAISIALVGYFVAALFLHGHFQRYLWLVFGLVAALQRAAPDPEERGATSGGESPAR